MLKTQALKMEKRRFSYDAFKGPYTQFYAEDVVLPCLTVKRATEGHTEGQFFHKKNLSLQERHFPRKGDFLFLENVFFIFIIMWTATKGCPLCDKRLSTRICVEFGAETQGLFINSQIEKETATKGCPTATSLAFLS